MLNFWKETFSPWRYPSNWFRNFRNIPRCLKWSFQRITRGYCDRDCWDMDSYLLEVLPQMLGGLRDAGHSYPPGMTADRWAFEIDEAIHLFRLADENYSGGFSNPYEKQWEECWALRADDPTNPHYEEIRKKYYEAEMELADRRNHMKDKALDWLKENFWDLWD